MERKKVYITGIGVISSIGNDRETVVQNLKSLNHGFSPYQAFEDDELAEVKLVGLVKDFDVESSEYEDWSFPSQYRIRRDVLRGLAPHGVYAYCAMQQAIEDARLTDEDISNPDTGIYTSSAGSPKILTYNVNRMRHLGPMRCSPTAIVSAISGTLSFNFVASFKILGNSCGFSSACASSAHAIGYAADDIALGRQKRMFIVAGEDANHESILPFAGMRTLSLESDPEKASCPFDKNRNGFVSAGGGIVLTLESEDEVERRGVTPYAELLGWGQASDGHNVAISHPEGLGLSRAIRMSLSNSSIKAEDVDYINAHATSTIIGDVSEGKAITDVFGSQGLRPKISSTKAITGHGLSLAGAFEAAIVCLSLRADITPGSAHIRNLDTQFENLNIMRESESTAPEITLSNSSGFGGANVSLVFKKISSP